MPITLQWVSLDRHCGGWVFFMTYSEKLKDPRWQKKRLEVLDLNDWMCFYCGNKEETLHVHHFRYTGDPWEASNDDLCSLCASCHKVEYLKPKMTSLERFIFDRIMITCLGGDGTESDKILLDAYKHKIIETYG